MKIVFFDLNSFDYERGCEKQLVALAKSLAFLGHNVSLVGESYIYLRIRPRIENIIYFTLGIENRHNLRAIINSPEELQGLKKEVLTYFFHIPFSKERRRIINELAAADVIYAKNEFLDCAYLYRLIGKKEFAKKVIIGIHTAIFGYENHSFHAKIHNRLYFSTLYEKLLTDCKFIHIPNRSYKALLADRFCIDDKKIFYIPYVIEESGHKFSPVEKDNFFTILFAGRLTEQKGVDYLRNIIVRLSSEAVFKRMRFFIAGEGELERIIRGLTTRFNNVSFFGFVEDMNVLYQKTDVTIVPSRWETVSYITLESQMRGIPVVSFNIPGPQDIIIDGKSGYLINLGDVDSFCEKIVTLYNKKFNSLDEFVSMGKMAYENIKAGFSKDKIVKEMENLFKMAKNENLA